MKAEERFPVGLAGPTRARPCAILTASASFRAHSGVFRLAYVPLAGGGGLEAGGF
jgi:hypothetical protein